MPHRPKTVQEIIAQLDALQANLPADDGLRWFNHLYCMVMEAMRDEPKNGAWHDAAWLLNLDVEFSYLYLDAVESWQNNAAETPLAWAALFKHRLEPNITPVQFALAGMVAHIHRDLPITLVRTQEKGASADQIALRKTDFHRINTVLDNVEIQALQEMATGLIKRFDQVTKPFDQNIVMAAIHLERARAWQHAEQYRTLCGRDEKEKADALFHQLDKNAALVIAGILTHL